MIFQHFKHYLDTETLPKKQDIVLFMNKTTFQAKEVGWHDIKSKIKTKQQNMRKKEANREKKLKRKLLQKQSNGSVNISCKRGTSSPQRKIRISKKNLKLFKK